VDELGTESQTIKQPEGLVSPRPPEGKVTQGTGSSPEGTQARTEQLGQKEQVVLDTEEIRRQLESGVALDKLPAIKILGLQIDKNYQDIYKKVAKVAQEMRPLNNLDIAYSLAVRFLKPSLYQRISEQPFGLKDFERFDNPNDLASLMPQILEELGQARRTIAQKRPEVKFSEYDGWLYLKQGHKGETAYRIYLSPKPIAIGRVFSDLAMEIPGNIGYQMKTFDHPSRQEATRIDKIIVYCSEDNFDAILGAVGRVYERHRDDFQGRLGPGGGAVELSEGVSVAKQPTQKPGQQEVTGTQEVEKRIKEKLDEKLPIVTRKAFKQYKSVQEAYKSDEGRFLWAAMSDRKEGVVKGLYFPDNLVVPKDQKDNLAQAYLETLYNATVRNYVEGKRVLISDIKSTFLKAVRARNIPLTDKQFDFLQNRSPYIYQEYYISDKIVAAARYAGLAIAFYEKIKAGQAPSDAFREILAA